MNSAERSDNYDRVVSIRCPFLGAGKVISPASAGADVGPL